MVAYYILFFIVLSFAYVCRKDFIISQNREAISGDKMYVVVIGIVLTLFMGLRATTVGCDVVQYINRYNSANELYNLGTSYSEWGYNYLSYFFHNILNWDFQAFLFIISLMCIASISVCIYKYSDNALLSIITYLTIGNFTINMSGLRQTIAISLTIIAIFMAERRKPVKFYFLVLLATIIHNSSIVFLPVYFLWGRRINRKQGIILLGVASAAVFYRSLLTPVITILSPKRYSKIDLAEGYAINILVILVPIIFCIYSVLFMKMEEDGKYCVKDSFFYIFSCINVFMLMLSLSNGQLGRLANYFTIGNMIVLASAIYHHKKYDVRVAQMVEMLVVALLLLYFFISTPGGTLRIDNYMFFWAQQ